jgi:hypothetical protein
MFVNLISTTNAKFQKYVCDESLEPKGHLICQTGISFLYTPYFQNNRAGIYKGLLSSVVDTITVSGDICTVKTLNSVYVFKMYA